MYAIAFAARELANQLLLLCAQNKAPKTLSPTASMYYTFLAVRAMLPRSANSRSSRSLCRSSIRES